MPEDDKKDLTKIFTAFKNVFSPEESRFKSLRQLPGDSPHVFFVYLKEAIKQSFAKT